MRRGFKAAAVFALFLVPRGTAADWTNATLVGSTAAAMTQTAIGGQLDVIRQATLVFTAVEGPLKGQALSVSFDAVTAIEITEQPGPSEGSRTAATAAFGLSGFLATSPQHRKILTIAFRDESGRPQSATFAVSADNAPGFVSTLERRTGKTVAVAEAASRKPSPDAATVSAPAAAAPSGRHAAPPAGALTNQDVTAMAQAGLSDQVIVLKIQASETAFDTSPQILIQLKKAGVSDTVLAAMLASK